MTDDIHSDKPLAGDESDYWRPVVRDRFDEFQELRRFVADRTNGMRHWERHSILAAVKRIIRGADDTVYLHVADDELREAIQPTAEWAGILKHATDVMREKIERARITNPDIRDEPGHGELSR
ncbi:MAG TPA: hypothetical protein VGE52_02950 [Pirellulales bacterium]